MKNKLNNTDRKQLDNRYQTIVHPLPPFYRPNSRVLILGSFPSIKTREMGFFYGHPQNRFWPILANLFEDEIPQTLEQRKEFLQRYQIAAWDTIYQCDIIGSSDSSIRNVVPTDLKPIIKQSLITQIFTNGGTSDKYYKQYHEKLLGIKAIKLSSSSPANARFSLERLIEEWKIILDF
ncbi:MAG: DNA-deoxyinosine glycosylase [Clostridiaceae bacterium]|nr:DNA-deoxyinosine glycosylase [Clostridiaceae bacterium]